MRTKEFINSFKRVLLQSFTTFIELVRIMLPVMILVRIGEQFGFSQKVGVLLAPLMQLVGLPSEAGLVWAVALLTNLYGGMGAFLTLLPVLDLTVAQVSILCSMMLFAHALPVELAVTHRAGMNFLVSGCLRVGGALLYGIVVFHICEATGTFSQPAPEVWINFEAKDPGWLAWVVSTSKTLITMFCIILGLFVLLELLKRIGFMDFIVACLSPVLRLMGIGPKLTPICTIGLFLGLSYGSGLILQGTREQSFNRRSLFLTLALLSFCHAIIEDTILMIALGADFWIVFFWRLLFSMLLVALFAICLRRFPILAQKVGA